MAEEPAQFDSRWRHLHSLLAAERKRFVFVTLLVFASPSVTQANATDPLPSWNAGPTKKSIVKFVTRVTDKDSKDYVRPQGRIAT